jgi:hypothetical protein
MIRQLSAPELHKFLDNLKVSTKTDVLIVYAFATWCGFCMRNPQTGLANFETQVDGLSNNSDIRGRIFKYDASKTEMQQAFLRATGQQVTSFPSIYCFYNVDGTLRSVKVPANGQYLKKFHKLENLIRS